MSFKIAGVGEVLWDLLPSGRQLGGAPANFAYHAGALGADARIISRVGRDNLGREALLRLSEMGVATDGIEVDSNLPTGTVGVELVGEGQPKFTIHENVAWDALRGESRGQAAVTNANAICFGTLAQRGAVSREAIRALVAMAPPTALRILDVNLRAPFFSGPMVEESLGLSNVLKLNDAELPFLATFLHLAGDHRAQIRQISDRFGMKCVAFTRGSQGSLLYAGGQWSEHPGLSTKVADTVGAGDAFTAAMVLGLLAGWDLDMINRRANEVASWVASCAGGMPIVPGNLRAYFQSGESEDGSAFGSPPANAPRIKTRQT